MIAYIRGILTEKSPALAVLEAAGVGYELFIPVSTYDRLPRKGEEVKLLTFHSVKEDDEVLYGFATVEEKELFGKLTAVSGVGPKIALAILSGASIGELSMSIASGDAKRLSSIKGVGKKTAEKICVELRDKVNPFAGGAAGKAGAKEERPYLMDAVAALRSLGFNEEISTKMVTGVIAAKPDLKDTETIIKLALQGGR